MSTQKKELRLFLASLASFIMIIIVLTPTVYADTNGTELKTTAQPDRLVISLGAEWAGAEFELKLDNGVFPVPVVANESGVIGMDLGGSTTYTLTLIKPPDTVLEPQDADAPETASPPAEQATQTGETTGNTPQNGNTSLHITLFLIVLALVVGGLIVMYITKKRRAYYDDYDDDYDDDEE